MALWDTAGQEDYDRLRPLSYPNTDVVLVVFSVDSPDSLENVAEKWVPEVCFPVHLLSLPSQLTRLLSFQAQFFCPDAPVILVATKKDLREDKTTKKMLAEYNEKVVSKDKGSSTAERVKAVAYVECSAKTGEVSFGSVIPVFAVLSG
jgi:Ras homolog gene family, member B